MSLAQPCMPVVGARLGDESGEVVAEAEAEARLSGISARSWSVPTRPVLR